MLESPRVVSRPIESRKGWGAGRDPLSAVNPAENGSPVWVTPVLPSGRRGSVAVCVDLDGDNAGELTDAAGYHYDRRLALGTFASTRVFDGDGDQTGMILYVCDGSLFPTSLGVNPQESIYGLAHLMASRWAGTWKPA